MYKELQITAIAGLSSWPSEINYLLLCKEIIEFYLQSKMLNSTFFLLKAETSDTV